MLWRLTAAVQDRRVREKREELKKYSLKREYFEIESTPSDPHTACG